MKGKITIDIKYDTNNPNEFAQEITIKKATILHLASAIAKLTSIMEQYATEEDKKNLANLIRLEDNQETTVMMVKPLGDA